MIPVLVVEDDPSQRSIIASILSAEGYEVAEAGHVDGALKALQNMRPAVVLTDLKMERRSGLDLVAEVSRMEQRPEIIVMTAFGSVETAVKAMRDGAYDYLTKPLDRDELVVIVQKAAEKFRLRTFETRFRAELSGQARDGIVARSNAMREILNVVEKVADSDATVLIRGETGTGKERIARLIHYTGRRAGQPFLAVNCAAFPENLLESELFGYEKGAFTGAAARKFGLFEAANGGTLFLDEIGDMSLNTQAKVLRVLQEKEIRRVGGTETVRIDVRIVAATNRDLEERVRNATFRDDLYYRLKVIPIPIEPLRRRVEDIVPLIENFLSRHGPRKTLSEETIRLLLAYPWPGNVRELEAVIERMNVLSSGDVIDVDDVPLEIRYPARLVGADRQIDLPVAGLDFEELEKN